MTRLAHAHAHTLTSPGENVREEAKCEVDPTYQWSSRTAYEESDLSRSHTEGAIAGRYCISFANQVEMEEMVKKNGAHEPNWTRHLKPAVS